MASSDLPNMPDSVKIIVTESGQNLTNVRCERCLSLVLSSKQAHIVEKEIFLPHMKKKTEEQRPEDGETLTYHWMVKDMFTFDNVGFTKAVGTIKYLLCADCEVGPVGWHDTLVKDEFYVAIDRLKHELT